MSRYFYHGIAIPDMLQVLQTGGLKCKRLLGQEEHGFNGLDYISVVKNMQKRIIKIQI